MSGNISDELTHLSANDLRFIFVLYGVLDALNFVLKLVVDDITNKYVQPSWATVSTVCLKRNIL